MGTSILKRISILAVAVVTAVTMSFAGLVGTTQQAYADQSDGTSQSVIVKVDGNEVGTVTLNAIKLYDMTHSGTVLKTDKAGYLYLMGNGKWYVAAATNYVNIADLFKVAGTTASNAWKSGASLKFTVYNYDEDTDSYVEEVYTKWNNFTYDFINGVGEGNENQNLFYNGTTQTAVDLSGDTTTVTNAILAFNYDTQAIASGSTAATTLSGMSATTNTDTRFMMGLNSNTADQAVGQGDNMGKRFPSAITEINIVTAS